MAHSIGRRSVIVGGALATLGAAACGGDGRAEDPRRPAPPEPAPGEQPPAPNVPPEVAKPSGPPGPMPTREFGKTGVRVTILGLGGGHAVADSREIGMQLVEQAYGQGIRFFDAAPIYNHCQGNYGEVLERRRSSVFLQTKTMARDRDGALRELEASLKAMRTDHLDSWLLHDVRRDDEIDKILGPGGALEAFTQAVDQKVVRFIGASCHSTPATLERLIKAHPLDCTIMSLNAAEWYDKPFVPSVLPVAVEKQMGIIAMKVMGYGELLKAITPKEALDWALSLPISVAIVGIHRPTDIDANAELARSWKPLSPAQMATIAERARPVAHAATFFRRDQWTT